MAKDIFRNNCNEELYIAKFYSSLPYYWGVIFAIYPAEEGSRYIVERYIVLNKNLNQRSGTITYPPINSCSREAKENKINLAEDINIMIQVMSSKLYLKDKYYFFRDMSKPRYTVEDLENDLKHSFKWDIAKYFKVFEHGFKNIANKTKCMKLKEDILTLKEESNDYRQRK